MSQDASTRQTIVNSSQDSAVASSWGSGVASESSRFSVNSYADRLMDDLMDDLFEDVERMLEGGTPRSPNPAYSSQAPRSQAATAQPPAPMGLPLAVKVPPPPDQEAIAASESANLTPPATPAKSVDASGHGAVVRQTVPSSYDRLLLAVGCMSVILTLGIWLLYQETRNSSVPLTAPHPTQPSPLNQADTQFAEYLRQSLKTLEPGSPTLPHSPATSETGSPVILPPTGSLPTVTIPGSPNPTASPRSPKGLERIYIPIFPSPPPPPRTAASGVLPLPSPGTPLKQTPVKPPIPLSVPGVARTVTGVVDMGNDQSALLVEINGVTQRFRIGESIGSSGWTVVEVARNQAIIRRNGEVRSVFIGQSF